MRCKECATDIAGQRNGKSKRAGLCTRCGRKARLAEYFRKYYVTHRDVILAKNRQWAQDNRERVIELRRHRAALRPKVVREPPACIDCGTLVVRAERCRKCYVRNRYATNPEYRARRLESTRRWMRRKRAARVASNVAAAGTGEMAASLSDGPTAASWRPEAPRKRD